MTQDILDKPAPTAAPNGTARSDMAAAPRVGFHFAPSIIVLNDPTSIKAEAINSALTHLHAKHVRDGRRAIALCAPSSGSGTSYVAANLAVACALSGINTLLIDGNLRNPGIDRFITPPGEPAGLKQILSDPACEPTEAIQENILPNLSLLYAGGIAENPQELLASRSLNTFLDRCLRDYEITIVDTPPANGSADARRFAMAVRYALLVVRRNDSFVADVRTMADELRTDRATVIGTFLNDY